MPYIYGILRHLHLSKIRRAANRSCQQFSAVECGSAEIGLRIDNPLNGLQVRENFGALANLHASVLILRFFHGYYPTRSPTR